MTDPLLSIAGLRKEVKMIPVLIIGKSGAGKSASLRNLPQDGTIVINVLGKPLPFRNTLKTVQCDNYKLIEKSITKGGYERYIIDDMGYLMTDQFMKALGSKGKGGDMFALYADIGLSMWDFVKAIQNAPTQARVYLIMHEDQDDFGNIKPRTLGKLVDQKVCLEGMVSICIRATVNAANEHVFMTQTNGQDVTKTPMGMFDKSEIDNDLYAIDKTICEYYSIGGTNNEADK